MEDKVCGQIIAGKMGNIQIRQKEGKKIELGDLLVMENENEKTILQVYDLKYGSLISPAALEQIAGLNLEGYGGKTDFILCILFLLSTANRSTVDIYLSDTIHSI